MKRRFLYDLHVHSCLSPCGEDDMTPHSIAGMAKLQGLELVALTDHNAVGNCGAFMEACRAFGIVPVPGMELTTAEDIHLVCLFPTLEAAESFGRAVEERRIRIPNKPAVFGRQLLVDAEDNVVGEEPHLLINATTLPLDEGAALAERFGGAAYPAHIDRESNGVIAVLGDLPKTPAFPTVELHDEAALRELETRHDLAGRRVCISSDAHNLWSLSEAEHGITLDAGDDEQSVRDALIRAIRAGGRT